MALKDLTPEEKYEIFYQLTKVEEHFLAIKRIVKKIKKKVKEKEKLKNS